MPGAARDAPCGLRDADHGGRDAPPYPLLPSAPCKVFGGWRPMPELLGQRSRGVAFATFAKSYQVS
jgi:hypothetical protein